MKGACFNLVCCAIRVYLFATHTLIIVTTYKVAKMEIQLYKMEAFFLKMNNVVDELRHVL